MASRQRIEVGADNDVGVAGSGQGADNVWEPRAFDLLLGKKVALAPGFPEQARQSLSAYTVAGGGLLKTLLNYHTFDPNESNLLRSGKLDAETYY